MSGISAFIDGASRGNPGPASVGVVLQDGHGAVLKKVSRAIGVTTNNAAETCALILAMHEALVLGIREMQIFTDSELVARQYEGRYKIKDPTLKVLSALVRHLSSGFKKISVTHIPREKNSAADREANRALDGQESFL